MSRVGASQLFFLPFIDLVGARVAVGNSATVYIFVVYVSPPIRAFMFEQCFDMVSELAEMQSDQDLIFGHFSTPAFCANQNDFCSNFVL